MKVGRQGSATSEFSMHSRRSLLGAATSKGGDGLPMISKLVGPQVGPYNRPIGQPGDQSGVPGVRRRPPFTPTI
jgi:hypothetical protein